MSEWEQFTEPFSRIDRSGADVVIRSVGPIRAARLDEHGHVRSFTYVSDAFDGDAFDGDEWEYGGFVWPSAPIEISFTMTNVDPDFVDVLCFGYVPVRPTLPLVLGSAAVAFVLALLLTVLAS